MRKKELQAQLDIATAAAQRWEDQYRDERRNSTLLYSTLEDLRDQPKQKGTVRYYIQAYDTDGVINEWDSKDLELIQQWRLNALIEHGEDCHIKITKQHTQRVNPDGSPSSEVTFTFWSDYGS